MNVSIPACVVCQVTYLQLLALRPSRHGFKKRWPYVPSAKMRHQRLADAAWKSLRKQIGTSATIPPSSCEGEGCQRPHHRRLILCCSSSAVQPIWLKALQGSSDWHV